jgi:hypothetical protein
MLYIPSNHFLLIPNFLYSRLDYVLIVDAATYDQNGTVEIDHDPVMSFTNSLPLKKINDTILQPKDHCTQDALPLSEYSFE